MPRRETIRIADNMARLDRTAIKYGEQSMTDTMDEYVRWVNAQENMQAVLAGSRNWSFDRKPLAEAITTIDFWSYLWGYHDVFTDRRAPTKLTRESKGLFGLRRTVDLPIQLSDAQYVPLPPYDAMDIFGRREIMSREQFEMLLDDYARREAFFASNVTLDNLEKHLYPAVQQALADGLTFEQFRDMLPEFLANRAHVETVFRTNLMSAYNSGHMDGMFDPLINDLIPAVQFMAIIDGRTTEICRRMDGQIIKKDTAGYADLVPPLHYNCRSTIIGVWIDEWRQIQPGQVFDPAEIYTVSNAPRPQEGFGAWRPVLNSGVQAPIPQPGQ